MTNKSNIIFPIKCKLCDKQIKSWSGLGSHIKNQHTSQISYLEYLINYYNYIPPKNTDSLKLNCEICGNLYHNLNTHLRSHKITGSEYKAKFNVKFLQSRSSINDRIQAIRNKSRIKLSPKERMGDKYDAWRFKLKGIFTLQWFINKYGKEQGTQLYADRCNSISKTTHFKTYISSRSTSNIAQELFFKLYNEIHHIYDNIYFNPKTHEHSCQTGKYNYDFVILDNKKIIEFNGDFWHANPNIYKFDDILPHPGGAVAAGVIWERDLLKINAAKNNGYDIYIIWHSDYIKDKNKTIKDLIDFIHHN